jgi:hypothetical protein
VTGEMIGIGVPAEIAPTVDGQLAHPSADTSRSPRFAAAA